MLSSTGKAPMLTLKMAGHEGIEPSPQEFGVPNAAGTPMTLKNKYTYKTTNLLNAKICSIILFGNQKLNR